MAHLQISSKSQYNNLNIVFSADDFSGQYMRSLALVNHTGRVFWPPPTKFRSTCPVDVAFFPFDDQTCILKLGSWLHDGYSVRRTLFFYKVHTDNYIYIQYPFYRVGKKLYYKLFSNSEERAQRIPATMKNSKRTCVI